MKKTIIVSLALSTVLFGADVVIKTAGNTATENGFTVKDNSENKIFEVQGDGLSIKAPKGRISDKGGLVMPVGTLTAFAGSAAPTGWLLCDGSAVSRTTYADLFAVIGTTYGTGDGTTTFNLPNTTGRNIIGKASSGTFASLNATSGAETHTLTTAQMPSHTHDVDPASYSSTATTSNAGAHLHYSGRGEVSESAGDTAKMAFGNSNTTTGTSYTHYNHGDSIVLPATSTASDHAHSVTVTVDLPSITSTSVGSGTAHNILDPYIVLNYIIKY